MKTPAMGDELHGGSVAARRMTDPGAATVQGTVSVIPGLGAAKTLAASVLARGALAAVIGPLPLICGCTADRTPSPGTPGPARAPASPAGAAQAAARAALAAYTGMWTEMQAAGMTADWKDPRLARYASGQALSTLVGGLHNARDAGIVIKGTIVTHPSAGAASPAGSPDRVMVTDCLDDARWLSYVAATGKLQNNVPGGHRLVEALVTRAAGQWTVSRLAVHAEGTC